VLPTHMDRAMGEALARTLGGVPGPGPAAG
jgi:hypothetical protein